MFDWLTKPHMQMTVLDELIMFIELGVFLVIGIIIYAVIESFFKK